jgi:hypothetical protein
MRNRYLILTCMILFLPHLIMAERELSFNHQQDEVVNAAISSPTAGQVVQGSVVIRGSTTLEEFQAYDVDFADSADPTQTWFLIQESTSSIKDGILAVWDTSTIKDGDYTLRLVVNLTNGDKVEVYVPDLHVRNYTPIETETPTPVQPFITLVPGIPTDLPTSNSTPTRTTILLPPTITPLPTNPAEITSTQVLLTFGKGALFTVGLFALMGAYLGIRAILYNRK